MICAVSHTVSLCDLKHNVIWNWRKEVTTQANLIAYTQLNPELLGNWAEEPGLLDLVAYFARVSNPKNEYNQRTAERLVDFLTREAHWSPLEMVNVVIEIKTTRDIAHQIVRHRSFAFQEYSQRYSDPTKDLDFVRRETRLQDTKDRQNSIEIDLDESDENISKDYAWRTQQWQVRNAAEVAYRWAIDKGIAKEQARAVLPEGMMGSRLHMNGSLRSWVHYIALRSGNGTQKEHKEVAKACAEEISKVFSKINDYVCEE